MQNFDCYGNNALQMEGGAYFALKTHLFIFLKKKIIFFSFLFLISMDLCIQGLLHVSPLLDIQHFNFFNRRMH